MAQKSAVSALHCPKKAQYSKRLQHLAAITETDLTSKLAALQRASKGGSWHRVSREGAMLDETFAGLDGGRLTARQADCIALVAKGLSSKEIARELGISPSTVDNHIASAMHLFGFPNRSAVAKWYQQYRESACANLGALSVESIAPPPPISNPQPNVRFTIPTIGGIRNSLSLKERLSAIGQVMIVSTMVTSAVVVSVLGLIFLLHQPTQGL